jgi:hypothetical protein
VAGSDSSGSGQEQVDVACEEGNGLSGFYEMLGKSWVGEGLVASETGSDPSTKLILKVSELYQSGASWLLLDIAREAFVNRVNGQKFRDRAQ